jgi:hypothetical protein
MKTDTQDGIHGSFHFKNGAHDSDEFQTFLRLVDFKSDKFKQAGCVPSHRTVIAPSVTRPTLSPLYLKHATSATSGDQLRYKNSQPPLRKGMETMKSVLLSLVALLAFTASINAEDKSEEQAVRKVLADL